MPRVPPEPLPVFEVLPELRAALERHPLVVLQAPPGAGKSTGLPLELLQEPWLAGGSIVMLQPRRVAARAVAARLAEGLGEEVGETVGYRVRFESRVSKRTRIEVVTEGILTRRLQHDPELHGVGLVVLDEFHERSLNADLALALLREVQGALRDDLRVLVMSATLDSALPERLDAPLVQSVGRAYPVEVRYLNADPAGRVEDTVSRAVREALAEHPEGDILAFLPGVREIRGAMAALSDVNAVILPLYGDLPLAEQRRALVPDPGGRRKVVLATSIAETSLTLAGVRVVIDGGLSRTQRFDPGTGLTRMVTERVTRDAAEQRAGRAGRTAPGTAYRLWSERTHPLLPAARPPEIQEADLAPLTLELAGWGAPDPQALAWLDPPPEPRLAVARSLLRDLDALDDAGRITGRGSALLDLPTHPRLAHLLHDGSGLGLGALAADVAALLEERDPLGSGAGADLADRVAALRAWRRGERGGRGGEVAVLERVERLSRQWRAALRVRSDDTPPDAFAVGQLVALAYPERVALAREGGGGRYLLAGGQGARLPEGDPLAGSPALAVAHLDAVSWRGTGEGRIHLAAPLDPAVLEERARTRDAVRWDTRTGTLVAQRERHVGALVLDAKPLRDLPHEARVEALAGAVRAEGLHLLNWTPEAEALRARVESLRRWRPEEAEWPDVSDQALLNTLEDWLGPSLAGVRTRDDLGRVNLVPALSALLPWPLPGRLDELAPTHLTVPTGSRIRLTYSPDGSPPVLAVKLQELFGLAETPTVNGGRTPVLLHLLSPAGRPVQVTQDLRSFWNSSYFEVRKDLRGRYPRHPWPDDPWTHAPMRGTKKRGE